MVGDLLASGAKTISHTKFVSGYNIKALFINRSFLVPMAVPLSRKVGQR